MLKLKSPYRDDTTYIVMHPQAFMQRLAALVPRPRLHLIRHHGVLAPNAMRQRQLRASPQRKHLRWPVRPGDVFAGSVPEPGGLASGALAVGRRRAH